MFHIITSNLLLFQAASAVAYLLLFMALFCCPYHENEFSIYNKVRKMRMTAVMLLTLQFIVQMLFGFRQRSALYGMACNMFFIYPAAQQGAMSLQYLMRRKDSYKKEWTITSIGCAINEIAVMIGAHVAHGLYLKYALAICCTAYYLGFLYLYVRLFFEYKKMRGKLMDNFAIPIEEHTRWMNVYIIGQTIIILGAPAILINNKATMTYAIMAYICFAYFVFKLMYYGHYVKIINEAETATIEEEEESPSTEEAEPLETTESSTQLTKANERLKRDVERWLKEEGFCDSNVTLISLARQIGVTSKSLSTYINTTQHSSFRDWLNTQRIDYACNFIKRYPNRTTEQVADCCGFNSRPYFDTIFKEKMGMTPTVFRKNIQIKNGKLAKKD